MDNIIISNVPATSSFYENLATQASQMFGPAVTDFFNRGAFNFVQGNVFGSLGAFAVGNCAGFLLQGRVWNAVFFAPAAVAFTHGLVRHGAGKLSLPALAVAGVVGYLISGRGRRSRD